MALTADLDTVLRAGEEYNWHVGGGQTIFAGGLVALNSVGYAIPAADASPQPLVVGRAEESVDNSTGASGDLDVRTRYGTFLYKTNASLLDTDVGKPAFIDDDETVNIDKGTYGVGAGIITEFLTCTLAWIEITPVSVGWANDHR